MRSLMLMGWTVCAFAAQPPAATTASLPGKVTIAQAVQEAVDRNLGLLAEKYNVSVADARIVTARLRPNPVFSAGLDYQDFLGTGFNLQNNAGPPEVNFRIDLPFERGGKRARRTDVATESRDVAKLQLLNSARQLALDVENAFVDVLAADETLHLAQQNLKSFESLVEVNTARVRVGDLAKVELVRSQVAMLQFRNATRQAEAKRRVAHTRLQALMGRVAFTVGFDVEGELRREPSAFSMEELRAQALAHRPDLLALRQDQARSLAELRSQQAQGKVDYTVGAMYHRQYDMAHGNSVGLFFSSPLPLFNKNQGEIERAREEREQTAARVRAAEAGIDAEVRSAWIQYTTSRDLLLSIESDLLQAAQEVRGTMEYSYRRGEASLVEFLDAQRAFNDAQQSYQDARADYARSLYLMDSISGKAVN